MPVRLVPITLVVIGLQDFKTDFDIKLLLPDSERCRPVGDSLLVQVMPDDHSKSVPPLPIPNRTVKRLCADDSAATSVKVGYRQASYKRKTPVSLSAQKSR